MKHVPLDLQGLWPAAALLVPALLAAGLGDAVDGLLRVAAGAAGLLLGLGAVSLWGGRVAPRSSAPWWVLGPIGAITALLVPDAWSVLLVALPAGLLWAAGRGASPSWMLTVVVWAVLKRPLDVWRGAGDAEAWWAAAAVLLGAVAAATERERLARTLHTPVGWPWQAGRAVALGLWTGGVLLLRQHTDLTALFRFLDPGRASGRMALLVLLVLLGLGAALLLRGGQGPVIERTEPEEVAPPDESHLYAEVR